MLQENKLNDPLTVVQHNVDVLSQLSRNLMSVMDKQIMAIIDDDEEEIVENAEHYANLKGTFKKKELEFVKGLEGLLDETEYDVVRLENLKKVFPESADVIDYWKAELEEQVGRLKDKHQRLNVLLDFAMNKNVQIFQSIYGLSNQKNIHYGSEGNKEDVSSGLAVNKKV